MKFGTKFGVWRTKKKRNTKNPVEMLGELKKQIRQLETAGELNQQIRQLKKMHGVQKIQTLKSYPLGARRKVNLRRLGAVTIIKVILQPGKVNFKSQMEGAASNKVANKSLVLASTATKKAIYHVNARTKVARQIALQEVMLVLNVERKGIFQESVRTKTHRMRELSLQAKVKPSSAAV